MVKAFPGNAEDLKLTLGWDKNESFLHLVIKIWDITFNTEEAVDILEPNSYSCCHLAFYILKKSREVCECYLGKKSHSSPRDVPLQTDS